VAFLKFSRDKRGYENFYLLEPANRGKARPRVLYWFRTPPNVKVGRTPFDPDMRHAVEAQNPGVAFDWDAIVRTPIPPPSDTERWRERRRVERAMRSAADVEDEIEAGAADSSNSPGPSLPPPPQAEFIALPAQPRTEPSGEVEDGAKDAFPDAADVAAAGEVGEVEEVATTEPIGASNPLSTLPQGGDPAAIGHRRRRRRRRGRKPQAQGEV
jgi:hypothetical protein